MRVRGPVVVLLFVASVALPGVQPIAAHAAGSVVQLHGDSADIDAFQFVDDQHQVDAPASGNDFIAFGTHRGGTKTTGPEGSAKAFVNQASTIETPAEPPFPLSPINDIAMDGNSTSAATATGNGTAVPFAFTDGSFEADFTTTAAVPVFFSGAIHTTNTDAAHSCSAVTVTLDGGARFSRTFFAYTGADCKESGPHQASWAESVTLPANDEYEIDVEYNSEVEDVIDDHPRSATASATASLNLSFFPPTARFTKTISGSKAAFDGSGSSVNGADDHLGKWEWTFGDGKTATTTKPKVTHTYPVTPARARTYTVTLRVVDAGGAVSPPVKATVLGTAVSVKVKKKGALGISGAVTPNRRGKHVTVALARKQHGKFRVAASVTATLTGHSKYATAFEPPPGGKCQVTVRFAGDKTHLASRRTKTFRC
jgi:hypothetical protein